MSEAKETVAELRAKLAEAEKADKAQRAAERREEQVRRRAENIANTDGFREDNYHATAGDYDNYVGVLKTYNGVEIAITEWTNVQASASLSREQAEKLRDELNELLG